MDSEEKITLAMSHVVTGPESPIAGQCCHPSVRVTSINLDCCQVEYVRDPQMLEDPFSVVLARIAMTSIFMGDLSI